MRSRPRVGALIAMVSACIAPGCGAPTPTATAAATLSAESTPKAVGFETDYQAVLLTNGQVFFGKLEGYGSADPILRDVYYVRAVAGDKPGAPGTNALVKRGQEWHAPNMMHLNPEHIVLVEPVARDSKVAGLIGEARRDAGQTGSQDISSAAGSRH